MPICHGHGGGGPTGPLIRRAGVWAEIPGVPRLRFSTIRAVPVAAVPAVATCEIPWGSIMRPAHRNTSWDDTGFEAPAPRRADLSEADHGVALLNECTSGSDVHEDVPRLSLIASATMPDARADPGRHRFTCARRPHPGDWQREGVIRQGLVAEFPGPGRAQRPRRHRRPRAADGGPPERGGGDGDGGRGRQRLRRARGRGAAGARAVPGGVLPPPWPMCAAARCWRSPRGSRSPLGDSAVRLPLRPFESVSLRVRV